MEPAFDATHEAARLMGLYGHKTGEALLRPLITGELAGRIALVSSFGTESAILLDMVARIDPSVPVLFLNTGKLFGETLRYRDRLVEDLGLTDAREIQPDPADLDAEDADGVLWMRNADRCCALRKVRPLQRALEPFQAWITGRKRYQGGSRRELPVIEPADGRIKINPLADWTRNEIETHLDARGLPRHPLEAEGFLSIGCMPCTDRVAACEDIRQGRWRGLAKTECGIHRPPTTRVSPQ